MNLIQVVDRSLRLCIVALAALTAVLWSPEASAQCSPAAFTTGYRYDAGSRLVGTIRPDPDGASALKYAAVRNTYSPQGLLTLVETGQLACWFDASVAPATWSEFTVFHRVQTTYDIWGRKLTETVADGAGMASALTQYSYDNVGRVECIAQRMNPAAYGILPESACTVGPEGTQGPDRITRNSYDTIGRILTIQKAYGTVVYRYDRLNRLDQITENGPSTLLASMAYDPAGRRATLVRGGGVTSTTFGYDGVSRLNTLTQDFAGTAYDEVRSFTHSPASQIVTRTLNNSVYAYSQVINITTNYSVNGLNQYTALASGTIASPIHDSNGNMIWDGSTTYTYDILNRLTGASGAKTLSLAYDPNGRLYQTSGGAGGTTRFLYDGDALAAEYSVSGAVVQRYVHGSGVDEPLLWYTGASVGASNRRYHHTDHQGSVIAATDSAGNALLVNTYGPYGEPAKTNATRFQYTGQIMLPDLGLYHYKARVYNPALGRFMQTDPVGYTDDLDLYTYVGNDPTNKTDPTGKIVFLPLIPLALKVVDVALTAYEVYHAAQTGGAASVGKVALDTAALAVIPGGKVFAKVGHEVRNMANGAREAEAIGKAAKGAVEGEKLLFRRGASDTKALLQRDAQAAENALGIHGVSVSTNPAAKAGQVVRCATCSSVEAACFKVQQTGGNPAHHTVELPKPITPDVVRTWNELFK